MEQHRNSRFNPFSAWVLILAWVLAIQACAWQSRQFLVIDASLVKKGQDMNEVKATLGIPDARRKIDKDREAWYYYHPRKRFYQYIPILGGHIGKKRVEVLEVRFSLGRVERVTFYEANARK